MITASLIYEVPEYGPLVYCNSERWNLMSKEAVASEVSKYKKLNFDKETAEIIDRSVELPSKGGMTVIFEVKGIDKVENISIPQAVTLSE